MPPTPLRRRAALGMLSAPFALAAVPCSSARAAEPIRLRVGAIPIDPCGELFYAARRGSFAKAGVDVRIQMMSNGASIAAAIAGGALDLGLSDLVSVASGHARGLPFTYVAPAAVYTSAAPGHALFVKPSASIRTARDFAGKAVAVDGLHSIDQVTIQAWIDKNGGDWRAVKFVELPYPTMAGALDNGTVDAIVITEPGWSLTRGRFRGFALGDSGVAERFLISGYVASKDWAGKNGEAVRRYAAVIRATGQWANANHAASAAILAHYSNVAPALLTAMHRSFYGDVLEPALLQPLIDAGVRYGAIAAPFPADEIIFAEHRSG